MDGLIEWIPDQVRDDKAKHSPTTHSNNNDPLLVVVLMVKDEAAVIRETLQPFIDAHIDKNALAFFIFDTGSTDDTIAITKKYFQDKHVHNAVIKQEPFVDFATSRNRGLQCAQEAFPQASFMLMPDAEWYIHNVEGLVQFCASHKEDVHTAYLMRLLNNTIDFYSPRLIRCHAHVHFVGVVHEVLNQVTEQKVSPDVYFKWLPSRYGKEKSQARWSRDVKLLLQEYQRNPFDPRTVFYVAQTYDCLDDLPNARLWYERRIMMPGWDEENFMACYRLAQVYEKLGKWEMALSKYLDAWNMRPSRAEPLVRLAQHYDKIDEQNTRFLFACKAVEVPYPQSDHLFVEKELYDYKRYDLLGISAWYVGDYELGKKAVLKALEQQPDAPHLHANLALFTSKNACAA